MTQQGSVAPAYIRDGGNSDVDGLDRGRPNTQGGENRFLALIEFGQVQDLSVAADVSMEAQTR